MRSVLSQAAIKTASPGDVLHDKEVTGLRLRVFPRKAVFYLYYRNKEGRQRMPSLGSYGKLTITQARDIAREVLAKVALGADPSRDVQAVRSAPTVQALYERWRRQHANRHLKPRTRYEQKLLWKRIILPELGTRKIPSITSEDVARLIAKHSAAPQQANHVLALLSKAFNLARHWKLHPGPNPTEGVTRAKQNKRRIYLTPETAAKLAEAMAELERKYPLQVALFRLLALTGARKSELMTARREWLRGDKLHLPDSKTGAKDIHLPPPAMAIVNKLPIGFWLFPGARKGKPMHTPYKAWHAVRMKAGMPWLRLHDLRHTYASAALGAGYTLAQIGGLLGHSDPRTTQRYAHLLDDPAREAAKATAETIAGWFSGAQPG